MTADIVSKIQNAENASEAIVSLANQEYHRRITSARVQAKKIIEEAIAKSEKQAEDICIKGQKEIEKQIEQIKYDIKNQKQIIIDIAQDKKEKAVEFLIKRVAETSA
jgi:vacuolar-type H+-ATPase subunit H